MVFDNAQIVGLIEDLEATRRTGRPGYPVPVMVKTILAGFILNIPTDTGLIEALGDNPLLSHLCGIFHPDDIPSPWAYSRFRNKLLANRELVLGRMAALVSDLDEVIPGFGETVAIDSTVMHAYSNGARKRQSDPDASWSAKSGRNGHKEWWFGYKGHLIADANTDIPMWVQVTTAKRHDGQQSLPLLKDAKKNLRNFSPKYFLADRGYDGKNVYKAIVEEFDAIPIILMRLGSKEPTEPWDERCDQVGTPYCDDGAPMQFQGYDREQRMTEWRCSNKLKGELCLCTDSDYGQVVNLRISDEYRRYCPVPRSTRQWKLLYNKRGSVERAFSRLKEYKKLDNLKIRGLAKVELHAILAVMVMQAQALGRL
ncbi:MAG: transposase [Chloroflexi bacterium]|nr:transposase [Chloroflexota bacterium]